MKLCMLVFILSLCHNATAQLGLQMGLADVQFPDRSDKKIIIVNEGAVEKNIIESEMYDMGVSSQIKAMSLISSGKIKEGIEHYGKSINFYIKSGVQEKLYINTIFAACMVASEEGFFKHVYKYMERLPPEGSLSPSMLKLKADILLNCHEPYESIRIYKRAIRNSDCFSDAYDALIRVYEEEIFNEKSAKKWREKKSLECY